MTRDDDIKDDTLDSYSTTYFDSSGVLRVSKGYKRRVTQSIDDIDRELPEDEPPGWAEP